MNKRQPFQTDIFKKIYTIKIKKDLLIILNNTSYHFPLSFLSRSTQYVLVFSYSHLFIS
jgi:hypothetical protein